MRQNGRIRLKIKGLTKNRENMKKDKSVQNRSKIDQMFPPCFPKGKMGGETNQGTENSPKTAKSAENTENPEKIMGLNPQPSLDEIWEWLGDPNKE